MTPIQMIVQESCPAYLPTEGGGCLLPGRRRCVCPCRFFADFANFEGAVYLSCAAVSVAMARLRLDRPAEAMDVLENLSDRLMDVRGQVEARRREEDTLFDDVLQEGG